MPVLLYVLAIQSYCMHPKKKLIWFSDACIIQWLIDVVNKERGCIENTRQVVFEYMYKHVR